jgi:Family of unknown function (DUF6229)
MPTAVLSSATEAVLAAWRAGEGADNPAGPLFVGGQDAERDLVEVDFLLAGSCSACTASRPAVCC